MLRTEDIINTIRMFQQENLDVRTTTLGVNLLDCSAPNVSQMCSKIKRKILRKADRLVSTCADIEAKYGIPIVNKRLAVSPISAVAAGHGAEGMLAVAQALDETCVEAHIDLVGGYTALVQKGWTAAELELMHSLPRVLSSTTRVCASVNVASHKAGINMDAVAKMGELICAIAEKTADQSGFGCAKLVVFANIPEDNPFMAGAYLGYGEPEYVLNIGVSGPGVVKRALERMLQADARADLGSVAEEIKTTSFRVTRIGELIGREVAKALEVEFGIVDLSLAPTPKVGDSVGEILQVMGIEKIGAPGSTAALALLNDAVKKGGLFASSSVGGLSGAFIPVCEDIALANAVAAGHLSLEKLEAMTSVCSVGLDMIAVPGDIDPSTIAAIIADEAAIGVVNNKTTAVRIIPVPGKQAGDKVSFGGLFGESVIIDVRNAGAAKAFVDRGGRIPAPLQSLSN
jgi:uncharacterized protein (UPF0210 family)